MNEITFRGCNCKVDYFDTFRMANRFNEPARIISLRKDNCAVVEVNYPIKKRIILPFSCIKVECKS